MEKILSTEHAAPHDIKAIVFSSLSSDWESVDHLSMHHTPAVAIQWLETVVGLKRAIIYLEPGDSAAFILKANYESEGRNVLEAISFDIDTDNTSAELGSMISKFITDIDRCIAGSHAVKMEGPPTKAILGALP
jgi:hypothetical protein